MEGAFKPDLAKIHPLVTSFKASDQFVPRRASINDLLKAVDGGDLSQAKVYLDQGVDVNGKNNNGWSAAMIAASRGNLEMLKLLIEKGADVSLANSDGNTALHIASFFAREELVELLLKNGASVRVKNGRGETPVDVVSAQVRIATVADDAKRVGAAINHGCIEGAATQVVHERVLQTAAV